MKVLCMPGDLRHQHQGFAPSWSASSVLLQAKSSKQASQDGMGSLCASLPFTCKPSSGAMQIRGCLIGSVLLSIGIYSAHLQAESAALACTHHAMLPFSRSAPPTSQFHQSIAEGRLVGYTHAQVGVFQMQEEGLMPVADPSVLFVSDRTLAPGVSGAVTVMMEGTRPMLIEVQALCSAVPQVRHFSRSSMLGLGFEEQVVV